MPGELFVQERVVRGPYIERIVVLADLALEEQPGFRAKSLAEGLINALRFVQRIPQNPAFQEIRYKGIRFGVPQHSPHLLLEHGRIAKRTPLHSVKESRIRGSVPDEFSHS